MAICAACGSKIVLGGIKTDDPDVRYCNQTCQNAAFLTRFHASLHAAGEDSPPVAMAPKPARVKDDLDSEVFRADNAPDGFGVGDLMVIVLGLAWAAGFSALTSWICTLCSYPFYAQTFWFVVPFGAFLCGMGGGIGFWLTLRMFNRLPNRLTYFAAGLGGAAAYIFIFGFMWLTWEQQGLRVRDHMAFAEFLQFVVENQTVRVGRKGAGIELGKWGYARFALNLAGYAFGVVSSVAIGGSKSFCPTCRRYFRTIGKQARTTDDPEVAGRAMRDVIVGLKSGRIQEAIDLHADLPQVKKGIFTSTMTLESCPGCGAHQATLGATLKNSQGVEPIAALAHQATTPHAVVLPS